VLVLQGIHAYSIQCVISDVGNAHYVVPLYLHCRIVYSGCAVHKALGHCASRHYAIVRQGIMPSWGIMQRTEFQRMTL
jgi:hypothetical protein